MSQPPAATGARLAPGRLPTRRDLRRLAAELDALAFCSCGHTAEFHRHYRLGSDCGSCPCPRYRPPRRRFKINFFWRKR
jgi:hypothetical protein